ncbi:flagellar brake protein [Desulforudis sp. 1088]|uniref:flagellar brake protein n=1 Tax=unclassified Candidatus Desulforudis TaxID=2635950 RepID=UPI003CE59788
MQHLVPGLKLEVAKLSDPSEFYVAALYEVLDGFLVFTCPYQQRAPLILEPGDEVQIRFRGGDAVYAFEATIHQKAAGDTLLYVVAHPSSVRRIQRREFARINTLFGIRVWPSPEHKARGAGHENAQVINISGGGLRFTGRKRYALNQLLAVNFVLPRSKVQRPIEATAKVVRTEPWEKDMRFSEVSVYFKDISIGDQDRIVGFILGEMSRQKSLLVRGE